MLRSAIEADRAAINEYLYQRPAINLFLIGDIEQYGFDSDIQTVFIDEEEGRIHGIILIYRQNMVIQSYEGRVYQKEADEIISNYGITDINGEKDIIEKYVFDGFNSRHECGYASCERLIENIDTSLVEVLGEEDAEDIIAVTNGIFPDRAEKAEVIKEEIGNGFSRYYGIRADGKLVSLASTSGESRKMAMLVGVGTLPQYRGRGYARQIVSRLTNDLLEEGKLPCLFYFNPVAARIYLSLGYEEIGKNLIYSKERD